MAILACAKSLIQLSLLPRLRVIADRRLQTRSGAPYRSCPLGARRPVFAPRPRSCFWSKPHVGTPAPRSLPAGIDRKSAVEGTSVSVLVDLGGRRSIKK